MGRRDCCESFSLGWLSLYHRALTYIALKFSERSCGRWHRSCSRSAGPRRERLHFAARKFFKRQFRRPSGQRRSTSVGGPDDDADQVLGAIVDERYSTAVLHFAIHPHKQRIPAPALSLTRPTPIDSRCSAYRALPDSIQTLVRRRPPRRYGSAHRRQRSGGAGKPHSGASRHPLPSASACRSPAK